MLSGTFFLDRDPHEYRNECKLSEDVVIDERKLYKIHSNALLPKIKFSEALIIPEPLYSTPFLNVDKLRISNMINTQNYISAMYVGNVRNTEYKMGDKFEFICKDGKPDRKYRRFGTDIEALSYNDTESIPLSTVDQILADSAEETDPLL